MESCVEFIDKSPEIPYILAMLWRRPNIRYGILRRRQLRGANIGGLPPGLCTSGVRVIAPAPVRHALSNSGRAG
jgi:hypothetical protein